MTVVMHKSYILEVSPVDEILVDGMPTFVVHERDDIDGTTVPLFGMKISNSNVESLVNLISQAYVAKDEVTNYKTPSQQRIPFSVLGNDEFAGYMYTVALKERTGHKNPRAALSRHGKDFPKLELDLGEWLHEVTGEESKISIQLTEKNLDDILEISRGLHLRRLSAIECQYKANTWHQFSERSVEELCKKVSLLDKLISKFGKK